MNTLENKTTDFTGYDYKEIITKSSQASMLLDCYQNFGWIPDENMPVTYQEGRPKEEKKQILYLKRDRKIINKTELTRLQRNFEACLHEIEALEKSRTSAATIWALVTAFIGTAFMAGSTFAVTAEPPHIVLCIILAVPGLAGWTIPYFLYKWIVHKQTERITPLIEEKYEEIYDVCEKGGRLLF